MSIVEGTVKSIVDKGQAFSIAVALTAESDAEPVTYEVQKAGILSGCIFIFDNERAEGEAITLSLNDAGQPMAVNIGGIACYSNETPPSPGVDLDGGL